MDPCDKYQIHFQWCLNWRVKVAFRGEKIGLPMAKEVALQEAMVVLQGEEVVYQKPHEGVLNKVWQPLVEQ